MSADPDGNGVPDSDFSWPAVVWTSPATFSQYLGSHFWVEIEFQARAGCFYEIYTSTAATISPASLLLWSGPHDFDTPGLKSLLFPNMLASDFQGRGFYLVERTFAPAGVQLNLPVVGDLIFRRGVDPATEAVTAGLTIPLGAAGLVTIDVSAAAGSVVRQNGGVVTVSPGATVNLGGGWVLSGGAGGVTLQGPGGAVLGASAAGISLTLPGGVGVTVAPNGAVTLDVPLGAAGAVLQNAVDRLGRALGLGVPGGPQTVGQIVAAGAPAVDGAWVLLGQILLGSLAPGDYDVWVNENQAPRERALAIRLRVSAPPAPKLAVDANRDGTIVFDGPDATSAAAPYRFWINDDDDSGSQENSPPQRADSADQIVNSSRDCEDLTRIWINAAGLIDMVKDPASDLYLGLKWKNTNGTHPGIRLFRSADTNGGLGYIKDATIGLQQATITPPGGVGALRSCLGDADAATVSNPPAEFPWTSGITKVEPIVRAADFIFRKDGLTEVFGNRTTGYVLIEGVQEGKGELLLVVVRKKSDGTWEKESEGGSVWLDLENVKTMYEQYRATPSTLPRPFDSTTGPFDPSQVSFERHPGRSTFQKPVDEDQKLLVFVNGSNETYAYSTSVAETLFKRLWWQGYKGRLVSFRWETLVGPFTGVIPAHYNLNEWLAWNWGKGLNDYLTSSNAPSGYTVSVAAHSLGNTVVASALRLGMQASNVVLLQGAIPAGCFDTSGEINGFQDMLDMEANRPTPDFAAALGYRGFVTNPGGATIYNFFNVQDFALSTGPLDVWEGNQKLFKPDPLDVLTSIFPNITYDYDATTSGLTVSQRGRLFNIQSLSSVRYVATPYESMSFIARSRSKALGARENVKGLITHEVAIGPNTPTNLQNQRSDHSGEFSRPIQQLGAFYQTLSDIVR